MDRTWQEAMEEGRRGRLLSSLSWLRKSLAHLGTVASGDRTWTSVWAGDSQGSGRRGVWRMTEASTSWVASADPPQIVC